MSYSREQQPEAVPPVFFPKLDYTQLIILQIQMCIQAPPQWYRQQVGKLRAMVLSHWQDDEYIRAKLPIIINGHLNREGYLVRSFNGEEEKTQFDPIFVNPNDVFQTIMELLHRQGVFDQTDKPSLMP